MRTYYRLCFKDGSHGAWETDRDRVIEDAEFFRAEILEERS